MKEDFVQYVWKTGNFNHQNLVTTHGDKLLIHKRGYMNPDSGPDFFNAKIELNETKWAGNIEIHIKSSDWDLHRHQKDAAYNNVILHVVWEDDKVIYNNLNEPIPTLILSQYVWPNVLENYNKITQNLDAIPCASRWPFIDPDVKGIWIERMLIERIEYKSLDMAQKLDTSNNDWDQVFYIYLCRSFGLKVNADPFVLLAQSLPIKLLYKHIDNPIQVEALFFGMAGLLDKNYKDDYARLLYSEFAFLCGKYNLLPDYNRSVKFSKIRPAAFPTIRLGLLAALLCKSEFLFAKLLEVKDVSAIRNLLEANANEYWSTHYRFDELSEPSEKHISKDLQDIIIINTIVPMLFLYGQRKGNLTLQDLALTYLQVLRSEKNAITGIWEGLGERIKSSAESQSYIHLYKEYCSQRQCMSCHIGHHYLAQKNG